EFDLSGDLPRLLYVKAPATGREPRLAALLARVEERGTESYRTFATADELGRLVRAHLALLLAAGFAGRGRRPEGVGVEPGRAGLPERGGLGWSVPVPLGRLPAGLRGRDGLLAELNGSLVSRRLARARPPSRRVWVLTGMGGLGKSAVALAAARSA